MRYLLVGLVLITIALPLWADKPHDIVEQAITAQGGVANLERWGALRATIEGKDGDNKYSGIWHFATPNLEKVVLHAQVPDIGMVQAIMVRADGKGWMEVTLPGQAKTVVELDNDTLIAVNAATHESYVSLLLPLLRDRKFTLTLLPEAMVAQRPAIGVRASYPGQPDIAVYFDKESHLMVKTSYEDKRKKQQPGKNSDLHETVFSDYREMGVEEEILLKKAGIKTDVPSLRAHLAGLRPDRETSAQAKVLVKNLSHDSFDEREKSSEGLIRIGAPAIPALLEAKRHEDPEVVQRAQACLEKIRARINDDTTRAAVRLLVLRAPTSAAETLLALLPGAEEILIEDIRAALVPLAQKNGGPDPVLLRAVDDKDPTRRDTARAVLGKDDGAWLNRPGRRLLLPGARFWFHRSQVESDDMMEITVTDLFNGLDAKMFVKP